MSDRVILDASKKSDAKEKETDEVIVTPKKTETKDSTAEVKKERP